MLMRYVQLGGVMMWPLLLCSVLLGAVLFERAWTVGIRGRLFAWRRAERSRRCHRPVLRFFVEIPPSMGLLGTVIGVTNSFRLTEGRITAESAAAGLGVACFTTIAGLLIALVASISVYILDWADRPRHRERTTS
jgi:biopolymer transport protein ExbB/TolQ